MRGSKIAFFHQFHLIRGTWNIVLDCQLKKAEAVKNNIDVIFFPTSVPHLLYYDYLLYYVTYSGKGLFITWCQPHKFYNQVKLQTEFLNYYSLNWILP